jgi:hypothetical protein
MVTDDLLEALLRAALAEKVLDAATLPRFAKALRARAEQILAERVQPIEERAAAFERESAWRASVVADLERENAWRASVLAGLEQENAWRASVVAGLVNESVWRAEVAARLEKEKEALAASERAASEAHDRLLEHHRATLLRLADCLDALPAELPWSYRRVRARLLELAETIREGAR